MVLDQKFTAKKQTFTLKHVNEILINILSCDSVNGIRIKIPYKHTFTLRHMQCKNINQLRTQKVEHSQNMINSACTPSH